MNLPTVRTHAAIDTAAPDGLANWLQPQATPLPTSPNADYTGAVRLGLWILGAGLGGFLLWATLAPLDEGVPAQGVLAVESKRKRIDHLAGGLVEKILVREGQHVQEGEVLIVLNETQAKAALNSSESQWRNAAAAEARLKAERDGLGAIVFPPELLRAKGDPEAAAAMRAQEGMFRSRRTALEGELRILRESARGLESQLRSLDVLKAGRERQVALFTEQLDSFRILNKQGFVSRNHSLDMERQLAEIQSKQSEDLANIGAISARLAELRMRETQRMVEYRREVETQMAEAQREASTLAERLAGMRDTFVRLAIRAPVSGSVVDVTTHTVGGVVKPGERIMDIVPDGDDLIVEARIPPQYIDRVHAGMAADMHFDSYASLAKRPVIRGTVAVVSADALIDQRSGIPYYSMRVSIPISELNGQDGVKLQPGMNGTVMIKTGERSLLAYLLRPLVRRFSSALSEH
jgi:HlyD family type I secretion membrane fusion protein